ncbi:hypothetical protein GCM10009600_01220 [Oerskovia paurometabola]
MSKIILRAAARAAGSRAWKHPETYHGGVALLDLPHDSRTSDEPAPRADSLPVHRPGPSRLTAGPSTVLGTLIGVTVGTSLLAGPGLILGALVGIGFGLLKDNPRD